MDLRSFSSFRSVIPRPRPGLGRGLNRTAVENHGGRVWFSPCKFPQQRTQIFHQYLETASPNPALGLLVDHGPRRQIVGHHSPVCPGFDQPTQCIEYRPQRVLPLLGVLPAQGQIRRYEGPFLIAYIARIPYSTAISHALILRNSALVSADSLPRSTKVNNRL